jgi:hypothetical protein
MKCEFKVGCVVSHLQGFDIPLELQRTVTWKR